MEKITIELDEKEAELFLEWRKEKEEEIYKIWRQFFFIWRKLFSKSFEGSLTIHRGKNCKIPKFIWTEIEKKYPELGNRSLEEYDDYEKKRLSTYIPT